MKYPYEGVDFERFSNIPEEKLTKVEKKRLFNNFCMNSKVHPKKKNNVFWVVAACVCLVFSVLLTPAGENVSATVKQMIMGIGEHLGMVREDQYATTINQSKTIGKDKITLNAAVADQYSFRFSIMAEIKGGDKIEGKDFDVYDITINGKHLNGNSKDIGYAYLGKVNTENGKQHFLEIPLDGTAMPLNPKIHLEIAVWKNKQEHILKYDFVLKNEKMEKAQKEIRLNKAVEMNGKEMVLEKLIITPIGQRITIQNAEDFNTEEFMDLNGTDNLGNKVVFTKYPQEDCFIGSRENEDQLTYELDPEVTSYSFHTNDGKEFKIQVR